MMSVNEKLGTRHEYGADNFFRGALREVAWRMTALPLSARLPREPFSCGTPISNLLTTP